MTNLEFSNEFDTLLNTYYNDWNTGDLPNVVELDEYEKSLLLTKAQNNLIIELYNGSNPTMSFERTEELRRYLEALVKTVKVDEDENENIGLTNNSYFYQYPNDLMFITYEYVNFENDGGECDNLYSNILVQPITQDEFYKVNKNPFRGPNRSRVLRLDIGVNKAELISKFPIKDYIVRYMRKPKPIILINLPDNLSIDNEKNYSECELNSALHRDILERAVVLALSSKSIGNQGGQSQ